jgi:hypothetical protein
VAAGQAEAAGFRIDAIGFVIAAATFKISPANPEADAAKRDSTPFASEISPARRTAKVCYLKWSRPFRE